jgi:voltage-gated sodium channel
MNQEASLKSNSFIKNIFLNDRIILMLISVNAIIIFFQAFKSDNYDQVLSYVDDALTFLFIIEMIVKSSHYGWKEYLRSGWNKFDVILILLSIPSLVVHLIPNIDMYVNVSYLLVFRVFRVFKFFRFVQFFPQVEHIFRSAQSALSASFMVLVGFFVVIFIMAILSTFFFQEASPNLFGDPITAYYSTFQVFTVEGWNAIPDALIKEAVANSKPFSDLAIFFIRMYFIGLFIVGGIFGLSIVNSIFVDAMISDHDETEKQFEDVENKLNLMEEKMDKMLSIIEKNGSGDQLNNDKS